MQATALWAVRALGQQWYPSWSTCSTSAERSLKDAWKHLVVLALSETALPLFPVARSYLKTDRTSSQFRALLIKNQQLLPKKNSNFSSSISSPLQHRHAQSKGKHRMLPQERKGLLWWGYALTLRRHTGKEQAHLFSKRSFSWLSLTPCGCRQSSSSSKSFWLSQRNLKDITCTNIS